MGSNTLPNNLSANSRNIKKFQLQQKGKNILAVVLIVAPILLGFIIYGIYTQLTSPTNNVVTEEMPTEPFNSDGFAADPLATDSPDVPSSNVPLPSDSTPPSSGSAPSSSPTPGASSNSNSGGAPAGVITAANSIEANGIKGSPYIASTLDTSNIPDGTTIRFDRSSWTSFSSDSGSLKATATIYGQPYPGSVTFSLDGGSWKASGYSLEGQ